MTNNTPKPKPSKKATVNDGAIFDAVLDDDTMEQHAEVAEVTEVAEVVEVAEDVVEVEVAEEVIATPETKNEHSFVPASEYAVVGAGDVDEVSLSKVVYKNVVSKKSLSVHHIQRRLNERGYALAYLDKDGFYGDKTKDAMAEFQADNNIAGDGMPDMATLIALFENDSNVRVVA